MSKRYDLTLLLAMKEIEEHPIHGSLRFESDKTKVYIKFESGKGNYLVTELTYAPDINIHDSDWVTSDLYYLE